MHQWKLPHMSSDEKQSSWVSALAAKNKMSKGPVCKSGVRGPQQSLFLSLSKDPFFRNKVLNVAASPFWLLKSFANTACLTDNRTTQPVADKMAAEPIAHHPGRSAGEVEVLQAPEDALVHSHLVAIQYPQQTPPADASRHEEAIASLEISTSEEHTIALLQLQNTLAGSSELGRQLLLYE